MRAESCWKRLHLCQSIENRNVWIELWIDLQKPFSVDEVKPEIYKISNFPFVHCPFSICWEMELMVGNTKHAASCSLSTRTRFLADFFFFYKELD